MNRCENHSLLETQSNQMAVIPHVPIFIDDDEIENGSRIILKEIRPDWDLENIRYKVNPIITQ